MNNYFSIYLEGARILATMMVFVTHGFVFYEPFALYNNSLHLGRDGVVIFFVLSGYVITWCANEREPLLIDFAVNRAARIYSVALPGIFLGIAASIYVSEQTNQDIAYPLKQIWLYLPIYLSFVGSAWGFSEVPPCVFPYWSLNYEVWYYIIFASFYYLKGPQRYWSSGLALLMVGPDIIKMLPIWLAGSFLYYRGRAVVVSSRAGKVMLALTFICYLLIKLLGIDNWLDGYNEMLFTQAFGTEAPDQFLGDYLICLVVLINFYAASMLNIDVQKYLVEIIKLAASYSFSFYIFHIPIFSIIEANGFPKSSFLTYLLAMMTTSTIIVALSRFTEHKKKAYQVFFRALIRRYLLWKKRKSVD